MERILSRFILAAALVIVIVTLGGCNDVEETYRPDCDVENIAGESSEFSEISEAVYTLPPASPVISSVNQNAKAATSVSEPHELTEASELTEFADLTELNASHELTTFSETNGDTVKFTVGNIFSEGEYYTVSVTGEKVSENGTDINGELYGNFRLTLIKNGAEIDSLSIEVPDNERFLIPESVLDNRTYGCSVISNKRDFSADDYPDIIQLDFYKPNELEIPQYGRYFAIFGGRLAELSIYENGIETEPLGTHLNPRSEGRMIQRLCVFTPSGKSLMVKKYEYIFNVEQQRLDRIKL